MGQSRADVVVIGAGTIGTAIAWRCAQRGHAVALVDPAPERGAWYASFLRATSELEVAYHKSKELQEISWPEKEIFIYVDFLADFRGTFHDIRNDTRFGHCLDRNSYRASQHLARELLEGGSAGVVYPSVRHKVGTCIACFRPALVNNVRKGVSISIGFENAFATPEIREIK